MGPRANFDLSRQARRAFPAAHPAGLFHFPAGVTMTLCPFASWKPVANHSGAMTAHLGLVLHVQQGNGGLQSWFNNPSSGASSTWWVSKSGALEQYVDADQRAWAQAAGNTNYNSIETEGYVQEPLTTAQEDTLAKLYRWGAGIYHWPNSLAESPGQPGFAWHGMGGAGWGGHTACPGDLRKNRRRAILDIAFNVPAPIPPAPIPPEDEDMANLTICAAQGDGNQYVTDMCTFKRHLANEADYNSTLWCLVASGAKVYHQTVNDPIRVPPETLNAIPLVK